jgi:hypothetical protein
MRRGLRHVVPLLALTIIACGGHERPRAAVNRPPAGGFAVGGGSPPAADAACKDLAGTWLLGQNDCAGQELLIAQDGCAIAVSWDGELSGTVSGNALTFSGSASEPAFACTAAVTDGSLSGSCRGATADGDAFDCAFDAIFEGK